MGPSNLNDAETFNLHLAQEVARQPKVWLADLGEGHDRDFSDLIEEDTVNLYTVQEAARRLGIRPGGLTELVDCVGLIDLRSAGHEAMPLYFAEQIENLASWKPGR